MSAHLEGETAEADAVRGEEERGEVPEAGNDLPDRSGDVPHRVRICSIRSSVRFCSQPKSQQMDAVIEMKASGLTGVRWAVVGGERG